MGTTDEVDRLDPIVFVRTHVELGQDVSIFPNLQDLDYRCIEVIDLTYRKQVYPKEARRCCAYIFRHVQYANEQEK